VDIEETDGFLLRLLTGLTKTPFGLLGEALIALVRAGLNGVIASDWRCFPAVFGDFGDREELFRGIAVDLSYSIWCEVRW
jgi:hypothetical protein